MRESVIEFGELPAIREQFQDKRIVFVTGVFDFPHPGHARFLRSSKTLGGILVVGVGCDAQVGLLKPGRPVWPEAWRREMIATLKPVDFCFIGPPETVAHPLQIVEMGFAALRPDAYVIRHDTFDIPYRRELAARYGVEVIVLPRRDPPEFESDEVTTTLIIERLRRIAG